MTLDAVALGATLYLPATRDDLHGALQRLAASGLRSAVLCLEDSVRADEVPLALDRLARFLRHESSGLPLVFVRPRSAAMLAHILGLTGIERIAGFVIPKATADTMPDYIAQGYADGHRLMPTLETREACDGHEMRRLRDQLLGLHDRILALRIGGNDLLQAMGTRRSPTRTAYEGPLGPLIGTLVATFVPWGFDLTAPVMENYGAPALLAEELALDLEHGLSSKTAIHPLQVAQIHAGLAVPALQFEEATAILSPSSPAVFGSAGIMCEPATHARWAARIVRRAALYGVTDAAPAIRSA